jgi:hypothetical protein
VKAYLGVALAVLPSACLVSVPDYLGRSCDANHACVDGWQCLAGTCVSPDSGAADGSVVWQQSVNGFASTTVSPAGCCNLDAGSASDGNLVTASNVHGGTGYANGVFAMAAQRGQVEGHFRTATAPNSTQHVARVEDSSGRAFLYVYLATGGQLGVYSEPGTLGPSEVSDVGTIPAYAPGTDYRVEISWDEAAFRNVSVNGASLFTRALDGGSSTALSGISLGLVSEDAGTFQDFVVSLSNWQVGSDPNAVLTP